MATDLYIGKLISFTRYAGPKEPMVQITIGKPRMGYVYTSISVKRLAAIAKKAVKLP